LPNPRHESLVHAYVQGKSGREAGLAAGYKDSPSLTGNIARLRQEPHIVERLAEVAAKSAELAEIYDGWVLSSVKLFAGASFADFCKRDEQGRIVLVDGKPVLDFTHASEEQYRVIESLKPTKYGHELKLRDPTVALDKLMRHRGLMRDKIALTDPSGVNPGAVRFVIYDGPQQ
jgi:hypothetical protein